MARVNVITATSNHDCPKQMKRTGMWLIEVIDKGFPETKEGFLERESITNKEISLQLLINALTMAKRFNVDFEEICIFSDCEYIRSAFNNQWLDKWSESEWKNAKGKEISNKELWQMVWELLTSVGERYILPKERSSFDNWMHDQIDKKLKNG